MDKVKKKTDRLINNHLKQLVIKTCQHLWLMIMMAAMSATAAATTTISYYHNDHLGTPQVLTDENQNIVWQAEYDPFGKATITTEAITNNVRFPGQYFDGETSLHYNYFRTYDPGTGRYITSDPIGLNGGINTYAYVRGNPLVFADPFGLKDMAQAWGGLFVGQVQNNSKETITVYSTDGAFDSLKPGERSDPDVDWDSYQSSCGCYNVPGTGTLYPLTVNEIGFPEFHILYHTAHYYGFKFGAIDGGPKDCQ